MQFTVYFSKFPQERFTVLHTQPPHKHKRAESFCATASDAPGSQSCQSSLGGEAAASALAFTEHIQQIQQCAIKEQKGFPGAALFSLGCRYQRR